jgi:hypothetical protein
LNQFFHLADYFNNLTTRSRIRSAISLFDMTGNSS